MNKPLRIGVIGLGSRWHKQYKSALLRLRERYQIRAVYDPVQAQAAREAKQLGCGFAVGVSELILRHDVEAVVLLGRSWFGLWPLGLACELGKPVFCATPLEAEAAHADELLGRIEQAGNAVMMGLSPRFAPAVVRLYELLTQRLGRPRLLLCEASRRWRANSPDEVSLPSLGVVDCCLWLLDSAPQQVWTAQLRESVCTSLFVECAERRGMQLTSYGESGSGHSLRLQAVTERGLVTVELPNRLSWRSGTRVHSETLLGHRPKVERLLEQFWQVARTGATAAPSFAHAHRAWEVLRTAKANHGG
jgi:predicted dehydrogenase